MKRDPGLLCVLTLALFVGCTPLGEKIVRKVENEPFATSPSASQAAAIEKAAKSVSPLDPASRSIIGRYGRTIRKYADAYGFDWRLVLAVMKQESRFVTGALSHRGARGLMQIMPVTGEELARELAIDDITIPEQNIRGGVFYLRRLYDMFEGADDADRLRLALAAYNAGISRVYDAQDLAAYMHENPLVWRAVRDAMPLLSRQYQTLHRSVWAQERPRAGWFRNPRETVTYVDNVMTYYEEYCLLVD